MAKAIKAGLLIDGTGQEPMPDVVAAVERTTIQKAVPQSEMAGMLESVS